MAATRETRVVVSAETSRYERGMRNVEMVSRRTANSISSVWQKVGIIAAAATATGGIVSVFKDGFNAVENMRLSAASMASTITSFAKGAATDLAGTYKQALSYSEELVYKMEEWNAKTVATGENLTAMVETMAQNGVLLDLNNKKQEKGFLAIANALALLTQNQNQDIQFRQEIRGLMKGEAKATNLLATLLKQRVGGELKKHIEMWKEQGTLIESAGTLLGGFQEGAKDLSNTWLAVGTTLETMYTRTLRGMFVPVYEDIINLGKKITVNVLDQNSAINVLGRDLKEVLYKSWETVKNVAESALDIIKGFSKYAILQIKFVGMVLDGWGQILAILPAITKRVGLLTQSIFESVGMVAKFGETLWRLMSFNFEGAAEAWGATKESWVESGRLASEAFSSGFGDEIEERLRKYNKSMTEGARTHTEAPELTGKDDREKIANAQRMIQLKQIDMGVSREFMAIEMELAEQESVRMDRAKELADTEAENKEKRLESAKEFNKLYNEMGLTQFEIERQRILDLQTEYETATGLKIETARWAKTELDRIGEQEKKREDDKVKREAAAREETIKGMTDGFKRMAEGSNKFSKIALIAYKATKLREIAMTTKSMAVKAYDAMIGVPYVGPVLAAGAAAAAIAFGVQQAAEVQAMQVPSYDVGGISNAKGIYQTGNIAEAHIPIPSGKIPVKIEGSGGQPSVNIVMQNPVFQDVETQRQVFAQIAEQITRRVAPQAVIDNYNNDLEIRSMVRQGG